MPKVNLSDVPSTDLNGYPNPMDTAEQKAQPQWGLRRVRAMWANYSNNLAFFNTRRENDIINRKYREGMQSVEPMKNLLSVNGDLSYTAVDWTPLSRIPTIIDNVVGRLMNLPIKIQCNPIEPEAQSKFDAYAKQLYTYMYLREHGHDQKVEQTTGIPLIPHNAYVPETMDEAKLHLANFRLAESIAMEQLILWVNKNNDLENSRRLVIEDLLTIKRAALYNYEDKNKNIKCEYIDAIDVITPYSKYEDFRNITEVAVDKQYQLWELAEMNPEFTDQDLYDIAKSNQGYNPMKQVNFLQSYEGYYVANNGIKQYTDFNIHVLEFYFITQNTEVRVTGNNFKEGTFYKVKQANYEGETNEAKKVLNKRVAYTYGGKWVVGTNYLWDYKMMPNQLRKKFPDGSYSSEAELPITIIAPNIRDMENLGHVEKLRPLADQMSLAHEKFQQLLIKAVPPGIAFDVDTLDGLILKDGTPISPAEMLKIYYQTGSVVFSGKGKDGKQVNGKVVENLPNGIGRDFEAYIRTQQHYMQLMNDAIGFNSAVDASTPNSDALVGVQKLSLQATQNALRPTYMAMANLILRATKKTALQIQNNARGNYEAFALAVGSEAADAIKIGKDIGLSTFGLELELLPDEEEKMQLEGSLQRAEDKGTLTSSDVFRIRQEMKSNVKKAGQLMVMFENQNREAAQKIKDADNANLMKTQQASNQQASQNKLQEMEADLNMKKELLAFEAQLKSSLSKQEHTQMMEEIAGKNIGIENQARINNGGKVDVQSISTHGKLLETKDNNETKLEKERIVHESKVRHTSFQHVLDTELESKKEDSMETGEE